MEMERSAKDGLDLKVTGICWILCDCGKVYVRQSGRTVAARCKEHEARVDQSKKSVMAEHNMKAGHYINLSGPSVLDRKPG